METTLTIDKELLNEARHFTGIEETDELIRQALRSLIEREDARKVIAMGGTQPDLKNPTSTPTMDGIVRVDTSIWIDHVREADTTLGKLLESG